MPANLENSAVATGLEWVSFHSNLNERHRWVISSFAKTLTYTKRIHIGKEITLSSQKKNYEMEIFL